MNLLTADQHNRIMEWIESGMKSQSNTAFTEGIERTIAWFCEQAVKENGHDFMTMKDMALKLAKEKHRLAKRLDRECGWGKDIHKSSDEEYKKDIKEIEERGG